MPFLTVAEFRALLRSASLEDIVTEHVFAGPSYAFRSASQAEESLFTHLSSRLALARTDMAIVGSGKIGFSLNPTRFPRGFADTSDIDVVVVNPALFDSIWLALINWNYPWRFRLQPVDWRWARARRDDIFWGWFRPDAIRYEGISFPTKLRHLRDLSATWFDAFKSLSLTPELSGREINGRLYRTWQHALSYHVEGLRQISNNLQRREGT